MKIMEACFLPSNSFTKTLDLAPSSVKVPFAPKRKLALGCVTYCRLGSSSSPNDESTPLINADWRSFRARLVADEHSSRPEEASTCASPDAEESHSSDNVGIGEKWAHPLHEPEKGCLLIATEKLDGVHIFERTVILVLFTNPIGPTGVILNRPSLMSIREIGSKVLDVEDVFTDSPLYFGGPLEEGLFLLSPKEGDTDSGVEKSGVFEEVMKGMYYGSKESVGCAAEMVKRDVVRAEDFRFFDGYCGWEKDQLKDEIRAGYWTVAACSPSVIGLNNVGSVGLWEEILGLMGTRKVV